MSAASWRLHNDTWTHDCKVKGERLLLTREQLSIYRIDPHNRPVGGDVGKWEYDDPPGCPWCYGLPEELAEVVALVDKRKRKK